MKASVPDLAILLTMFTNSFIVIPIARTLDRDGRLGLGKNDLDEDIRWGSIFTGSENASRSASASVAVITQAFIVII